MKKELLNQNIFCNISTYGDYSDVKFPRIFLLTSIIRMDTNVFYIVEFSFSRINRSGANIEIVYGFHAMGSGQNLVGTDDGAATEMRCAIRRKLQGNLIWNFAYSDRCTTHNCLRFIGERLCKSRYIIIIIYNFYEMIDVFMISEHIMNERVVKRMKKNISRKQQ